MSEKETRHWHAEMWDGTSMTCIIVSGDVTVCRMNEENDREVIKAWAELIIRACNAHDDLLTIAADVRWLGNNLDNIKNDPDRFRRFYETILKNAEAAFAEAAPS